MSRKGITTRSVQNIQRASEVWRTRVVALTAAVLMLFMGAAWAQTSAGGWTTLRVRRGEGLAALFQRAGLPAGAWAKVLQHPPAARVLKPLHPGDILRLLKSRAGHIVELQYRGRRGHTLSLRLAAQGWQSSTERRAGAKAYTVRISGKIRNSLISAAQRAGATRDQAAALAKIFHWRVDLPHAIHPGDRFALIYRRFYRGDQQLGANPILAAEITVGGRLITAFRYADDHGRSAYYDAEGQSLRPALLRTPLHYQRVSSPFSLNRMDPVTHHRRPHYGVDLAAPEGTPIKAAANGRVKFIGRQRGYGNLIILKDFGPYSTRYAHMRRFAHGLRKGSFVSQGQVIGYVGESGEATGPHLHFEVRVDGKPKNPLKVALPASAPIPAAELAKFTRTMRPMMAALNAPPHRDDTRLAGETFTLPAPVGGNDCHLLGNLPPQIAFAPGNQHKGSMTRNRTACPP